MRYLMAAALVVSLGCEKPRARRVWPGPAGVCICDECNCTTATGAQIRVMAGGTAVFCRCFADSPNDEAKGLK